MKRPTILPKNYVQVTKDVPYPSKHGWWRPNNEPYVRVEGSARVADTARVSGAAQVRGNARVYGNAMVFGDARVFDGARVFEMAQVSGAAIVFDSAQVGGKAKVSGYTWVFNRAQVFGNAQVSGHAQVGGHALVFDKAKVCGDAVVGGTAKVYEAAQVSGDARVSGEARVIGGKLICPAQCASCLHWTATLSAPGMVTIGCETHDIDQWLMSNCKAIPWEKYCTAAQKRLVQATVRLLQLAEKTLVIWEKDKNLKKTNTKPNKIDPP